VKRSVELGRLIDEAVASDRKGDASPPPDESLLADGPEPDSDEEPDAEET
jgi:hypothetical protein